MKKFYLLLFSIWFTLSAVAQMVEPVQFKSSLNILDNGKAEIVFEATIDKGWHLYSTDLGADGPISATFIGHKMEGVETVGKLTPVGKVITEMDEMFGMELRFFVDKAKFVQKIKFTATEYSIDCALEYGACNDQMCLPPTQVSLIKSGKSPAIATTPAVSNDKDTTTPAVSNNKDTTAPEEPKAVDADTATTVVANNDATDINNPLWRPVIDELNEFDKGAVTDNSLLYIFFAGFIGGFLALLTPCVWPIIPMTVSFFLKRNKDRKKAIKEAVTYGASIVIIYVVLGLAVTLIFGASALNALSTSAVFNILFCLLLVIFAASFFGAFELTLPASWSNKLDAKSENTSGMLSIFFMAFTLALVSFSCTGPIIGFLLVAVSTQGDILGPAIGMLGFAVALALPFTLFALFPSLLKSAPKSGGWMNVIKVVLGFIELAFALKFLSVADLAYGWHILDREVFISLWIVIFGLLGIYLMGWLKFPHDDAEHRTNVPQFFLGMISLAFTVYMIPGLWGAPLKAISAFAPPLNTQDFNLYHNAVEAEYLDYEEGMAVAKVKGKPVMVDFTGYGCVNCRKMEAAVWTDHRVADLLKDDYVLISLYVDDKTPLPEPIIVKENDGAETVIRTIGDKWSYLQRSKVGANTQPFYVLLDNEGNPINGSRSYDENIDEYIKYLEEGLKNFKNKK